MMRALARTTRASAEKTAEEKAVSIEISTFTQNPGGSSRHRWSRQGVILKG